MICIGTAASERGHHEAIAKLEPPDFGRGVKNVCLYIRLRLGVGIRLRVDDGSEFQFAYDDLLAGSADQLVHHFAVLEIEQRRE